MKGRIGTSRTKCAKTTRILCGAPHFMGFVLVCPAAENQGEISDEMEAEASPEEVQNTQYPMAARIDAI